MADLLVYRREGKHINEEAEFMNANEICYVSSERNKGDYLIILTTLEREYITYAKNVTSFVSSIATLENFIEVDRGAVANLTYNFEYNKDLGRLTYRDIKYKKENFIIVARKYEKLLKEALNKMGSDT